jgi:hypothetical protein
MARLSAERLVYWLPRLFLGIGIVAVAIGAVWTFTTARFVSGAERTGGTVIDLSRSEDSEGSVTYSPIVRFKVEGRTIQFTASSSSSSPPSVGERVEVLYDPDDPHDARLSGFLDLWGGPMIVGGLGIVFAVIGSAIVWATRKPSEADVQSLRMNGLLVQGTSPRVVSCENIDVAGRSPFRVDVDIHDPTKNEVRVLESEHVWFDPTPHVQNRESLDVYVDRNDPERYLVDLSFLPRLAE